MSEQIPPETVSHAQVATLVLQHAEIVYQPVSWPVASTPILSRRTWTEHVCLDSAHVDAFLGKATTPRCPSCGERLEDGHVRTT